MSFFLSNHNNGAKVNRCAPTPSLRLSLFLVAALSSLAQAQMLSLSSGTASADGTVSLNLNLTSLSGQSPASLQWSLTHDPAHVGAITLSAGPAATGVGKDLTCNQSPGETTCVLSGLNASEIANGAVAVVNATIVPGTGNTALGISNTLGSSAEGSEIALGGSGGTIVEVVIVPTTLSGLTCTPAIVNTPGSASCTAMLSAAAPAGGALIALSSSDAALTVPASMTIAAGAASATFAATAGAITTNSTVVVTASFNGSSQSASLALAVPLTITSLVCTPTTLSSGASSSCTVNLSGQSPSGGTSVAVSDNSAGLTVPASVTVAAGATSGTFAATAGTITTASNGVVTVTLNGSSRTASLTLTAPLTITSLVCTPTALSSGASSTCTVSLSGAAPTGGTSVAVSDNSAGLTVPASMMIGAGATSGTFAANAGTITTASTGVITASLGSLSLTASIQLSSSISQATCPCSVWGAGTVHAVMAASDSEPIEVGMKFKSKAAGYVLGVRFYKGSNNLGTHTAQLWTKNGTKLATVTFTNETSSGWQQAIFSKPVAIAANTIYVVSYYAPRGYYSQDASYFANSGHESGPLYALREGESGSNGVYRYTKSGFPNRNGRSSNYWVDVIFNAGPSMTSTNVDLAEESAEISGSSPAGNPTTSRSRGSSSPGRSLSCAPKTVRPGESFRCELSLETPGRSSQTFTVDSPSSDVLLPPTIRARAGQRTIAFRGTVLETAFPSELNILAGNEEDQSEDSISVLSPPAPTLSLPDTASARIGHTVSFTVSANDPWGLPVQLTGSNLPAGAMFNPTAGRFAWIPTQGQEGRYEFTFKAVNSANQSSEQSIRAVVDSGSPRVDPAARIFCSPGSIATLNGAWLTLDGSEAMDISGSSTELEGTSVRVNGNFAPLIAVSRSQVDFVCPSVAPGESLAISAETGQGISTPIRTVQHEASPVILSAFGHDEEEGMISVSDTDRLAVVRDYRDAGEPAQAGDSVVIKASGLGNLDRLAGTLDVDIGGTRAEVESIIQAGDAAGVVALRVRIPVNAPQGDAVPVRLEMRSTSGHVLSSNKVTMAIEGSNR